MARCSSQAAIPTQIVSQRMEGDPSNHGRSSVAQVTDKANSPSATYLTEYKVEIFYPD